MNFVIKIKGKYNGNVLVYEIIEWLKLWME